MRIATLTALLLVTDSAARSKALHGNVTVKIIRPMYSSPPVHGSRLATLPGGTSRTI